MKTPEFSSTRTALKGLVALWLAAVVLALGQLSVRPDWHNSIHTLLDHAASEASCGDSSDSSAPDPDPEAGCAIELYGNEGVHFVASAPRAEFVQESLEIGFAAQDPQVQNAARALQPPGRAPPFFIV